MLTRSAKAKGKRLEKWIVAKLLAAFPQLTNEDIRCTIGVETGADVKLSKAAMLLVPYSIEAKNREIFKTLYGFYEQAKKHNNNEPLVFISMNHQRPLALVDAEHFINLVKDRNARN